jgi:hypothetical protein
MRPPTEKKTTKESVQAMMPATSEHKDPEYAYLQDTAHPLEAVFLRGIRSLFCNHHDSLIIKYRHRKHSNSKRDRSNTSDSLYNQSSFLLN